MATPGQRQIDRDSPDQRLRSGAAPTPNLPSVFLSYARADNADEFVTSVYSTLRERGFTVWWDRISMPSRALTFLHEIAEAIDAADRLLLILSPTAVRSEYVRAEWQYALAADKVVTPVLRAGDFDLLPPELKGTHCEDVRASRDVGEALNAIVRQASTSPPPLGRADTVPVPPPYYRPRPEQVARIAERLALDRPERLAVQPQQRAFLIYGMGGVGKSVLAAAAARSTATRRVFSDGVIWVPAGAEGGILPTLQVIGRELRDDLGKYANEAEAAVRLRERLQQSAVLIVLDNVSVNALVEPIRQALGPRCRLIVTTREPGLIELGTQPVDVEPLSPGDAIAFLEDRARAEDRPVTPAMEDVAKVCGFLPFALALAGAMVSSTSWETLAERLRAADLSFMEASIPGYRYTNLLRALQVSVDQLRESPDPEDRAALDRYLEIAAFRWEAGVPEAALVMLWRGRGGVGASVAGQTLTRLSKRGLVRSEGQSPKRIVRLHDLQRDYLWAVVKERPREHAAILEAYARVDPQAPLLAHDDGYYLDNCFYHLEHAHKAEEMHALLARETPGGRNAWWQTRMAHGQALGFVADVRRAWDHAVQGTSDLSPPAPAVVARTARYALMTGSVRTALGDVPLDFVDRLLDEEKWSAEQALAVLEWVARGRKQLTAFAAVLPHLEGARRGEAIEDGLRLARDQVEEGDRAGGLLQLLPFLDGERHAQVFEEIFAISTGAPTAHSLLELYRASPERPDLLDRAIDAARATEEGFSRKFALLELARSLPVERLEDIASMIGTAGSDEEQAEVWLALAARLPEQRSGDLVIKALALLTDGEDFKGAGLTVVLKRARAVRFLPPPQRQAAAKGVLDEIDRLKWARHRVAALADVVLFLEGEARNRAEQLASELALSVQVSDIDDLLNDGDRGRWLAQAAPGFLQPLVTILLASARKETRSFTRTSAILALLPFLDRERRLAVLDEEERRSQVIGDLEERTKCVASLIHMLPPGLREPAVERALREIIDHPDRAPSGPDLVALAPMASVGQLDAMQAVLPRVEEFGRGEAAASVFAGQARLERWDQAFKALPGTENALYLRYGLDGHSGPYPATVARAIAIAAIDTEDPEIAGVAIAALGAYLPEEERRTFADIGLQAAEALDARPRRYQLLNRLIPSLPCDLLDRAAELIPATDTNTPSERDLPQLALTIRRADCGQLTHAIDDAMRLTYADSVCRACVGISAYFSEPTKTRLLERGEAAADNESGYSQVELLIEVAAHIGEPQRTRLVEKALALARVIDEGFVFSAAEERARALATVAPLLDADRRPSVIMEAWDGLSDRGAFVDVRVFEMLGPLLPEVEPAMAFSRWRGGLELASRSRRLVLEELQALAPLVLRLGGEDGVLGVIRAVDDVRRWWP